VSTCICAAAPDVYRELENANEVFSTLCGCGTGLWQLWQRQAVPCDCPCGFAPRQTTCISPTLVCLSEANTFSPILFNFNQKLEDPKGTVLVGQIAWTWPWSLRCISAERINRPNQSAMHLCLLCSWKAAVGRVGCLTVSEINAINSICLFALGRRGACCAPNACWSYYVSQKPKQCQLIARSPVPNKLHFCTKSVGVPVSVPY
jgi:hypothetical protein